MTTAYNEETGETLELRNGEWVAAATPSEVNLQGGGRGRLGWVGDTPELTQRLNTAEPADAFAVGALGGALAGPSVALGAGFGALSGVMGAEEGEGVKEGLIGAALGGPAGKVLGMGWDAAAPVRKSIGTMMKEADSLVRGVMPAAADVAPNPMLEAARQRAAQTIGRKVAPGGRALGDDFATGEELAAIGFPLTKAETALDVAKTGTNEAKLAQAAMSEEQKSMSGLLGGRISQIKNTQREVATNWVGAQLGLPEGQLMTNTVLADVYQGMGKQFDDFANSLGAVDVTDVMPALKTVQKRALSESKGEVDSIIGDIEKLAEKNGGRLSGPDWQRIRTDIVDMQSTATRQQSFGKVSDASDLMETLTKAMEDQLPDAAKDSVRDLRHRYALLSAVSKGTATNKEGLVNPRTLANNWKRPQSNKYKGKDEFGRMLNAFQMYTPDRVPNSGTADRLLQAAEAANVPGAGVLGTAKRVLTGN